MRIVGLVDPFEIHSNCYTLIIIMRYSVQQTQRFYYSQPYVIVYINPMLIKCWHAKANITYALWFNFKCNIKVITVEVASARLLRSLYSLDV